MAAALSVSTPPEHTEEILKCWALECSLSLTPRPGTLQVPGDFLSPELQEVRNTTQVSQESHLNTLKYLHSLHSEMEQDEACRFPSLALFLTLFFGSQLQMCLMFMSLFATVAAGRRGKMEPQAFAKRGSLLIGRAAAALKGWIASGRSSKNRVCPASSYGIQIIIPREAQMS